MKCKQAPCQAPETASGRKGAFGRPLRPDHALNTNSGNSKVLAGMWEDFVNPKKRMESEGPFLHRQLQAHSCKAVFDSCMGTGADSFYLIEKGYSVTSNEIDENFLEKALEGARSRSLSLKITRHDWREAGRHLAEGSFDAVLCLGNSLTYLFGREDQLSALENFRFLARSRGLLIVDVRNYEAVLENRERILRDGAKFGYSWNYVYCGGERVSALPVRISRDEVAFEYLHKQTGKKGHLVLYPFRVPELRGLLEESGFREITIFSDYQEGFNPEADFYQFVCTKP